MLPISIPTRASGTISSGSNWAMSAVPIYRTCTARSFALQSVCDTNRRSCRAALANVATCFSSFSRDQLNHSALKAEWFFHFIQTSISTLRTFNLQYLAHITRYKPGFTINQDRTNVLACSQNKRQAPRSHSEDACRLANQDMPG